jgi:predicted NBD/HSP70 family sugar kinase
LLRAAELRKKQLLGVGIGLAGVVDFSHGMVRQNPFFGWKNVPLRDLLEARLRLPVYIDNDVNALTLSEKWLSGGQPEDNFILITVGRGIGMGIVLNGQIYRGNAGGAGEFGHLVVDPNGPLCDCGKRGCLESILSDRALVAAAKREVGQDVESLDDLIRQAEGGQPAALAILERVGRLLGQQMANLVNLLDPKLILISGEGIRMGSRFFEPLRAAFREGVMSGLAEDTEIRVDSWGDDIWALGAASLVIAAIFNAPVQKEESAVRKT